MIVYGGVFCFFLSFFLGFLPRFVWLSGAGADFVMLGGMLAGHSESSGEVIEKNGKKYKLFYGMSSDTAMKKHAGGVAEYRWVTQFTLISEVYVKCSWLCQNQLSGLVIESPPWDW